jgi:hypothetical protein
VISRRDFFGTTAGLTLASWLRAQDAQRPVFWIMLSVIVTDIRANYVLGLKPTDFRILEDGIPQKISTFAEGTKPPLLVSDDGTTKPLVDAKAADEAGKAGLDLRHSNPSVEDLDNSHPVTYHPNPLNHNEGFRKINIEIVPDANKRWRVRSAAGYRLQSTLAR